MKISASAALTLVLAVHIPSSPLEAETTVRQEIPTPRSHFGFDPGETGKLADWTQLVGYYEALAEASPRVAFEVLGETVTGNPFVMLTITSPENHARIDELREIQHKLADPRTIGSEAELERLLGEGRTVAMITHGIHATEVGSSQGAATLAYTMASSNEVRITDILDKVVFLQIPSLNPDGLQWVNTWYNEHAGTEFDAAPLPWLYQFYVGHDNNRDWYAFTQNETVMTVSAQNRWHPHIVHDIHQMGSTGARIFFPPFIDPWEPNIDPALTTAVNQLGTWMAAELTAQGKKGVVVNAQYDAYTPARAYMHYHGGARILSETASARLASPIHVPPETLGPGRGFNAAQRSWNFPNPWPGGDWTLPEIVEYQVSGALALLTNAARNREFWLRNFHGVTSRAVAKWNEWPEAWIIPGGQGNPTGLAYALRSLVLADVEVGSAQDDFTVGGASFPAGSYTISMRQPWAGFANSMLEVQEYPDMFLYPGGPPLRPYDVTGHTFGFLMDFEAVPVDEAPQVETTVITDPPDFDFRLPEHLVGSGAPRIAVYKSWREPMPAGWQRWVFDQHELVYDTLHDAEIREGDLADYDVFVLQTQSAQSIANGFPEGVLPREYTGGLGPDGVAQVRSWVEGGGRLVAVETATEFVIDLFDLDIGNKVAGLSNNDFYIPGSILKLDLMPGSEIADGMGDETIAWYWRTSRAFALGNGGDARATVHARYGDADELVLSGWVLGGEQVAGEPAIVSAEVGEGSVILFGFQPNYRAQTVATWPLLFNSLR